MEPDWTSALDHDVAMLVIADRAPAIAQRMTEALGFPVTITVADEVHVWVRSAVESEVLEVAAMEMFDPEMAAVGPIGREIWSGPNLPRGWPSDPPGSD